MEGFVSDLVRFISKWFGGGGAAAGSSTGAIESDPSMSMAAWILVGFSYLIIWLLGRGYQRRQDEKEAYKDLDVGYLSLYQSVMDYPFLIDPDVTFNFERLSGVERFRYEAHAFRVWVVCETIYDALGLASEPNLLRRLTVWIPTAVEWAQRPRIKPVTSEPGPDAYDTARGLNGDNGKTGHRSDRTFSQLLRRNAFIAKSSFAADDWRTWRTALDIEARLHLKWFVAEARFHESFKDTFKLGILRRYVGHKGQQLAHDAFQRYKSITGKQVRDGLGTQRLMERLAETVFVSTDHATNRGVGELIDSWWGNTPSVHPANDPLSPK